MGKLAVLPNIGTVIEKHLHACEIYTPEELVKIGSKEAFFRIKMIDDTACLHMLYALQGAIEGKPYTQLTKNVKIDLKQFFNNL